MWGFFWNMFVRGVPPCFRSIPIARPKEEKHPSGISNWIRAVYPAKKAVVRENRFIRREPQRARVSAIGNSSTIVENFALCANVIDQQENSPPRRREPSAAQPEPN